MPTDWIGRLCPENVKDDIFNMKDLNKEKTGKQGLGPGGRRTDRWMS